MTSGLYKGYLNQQKIFKNCNFFDILTERQLSQMQTPTGINIKIPVTIEELRFNLKTCKYSTLWILLQCNKDKNQYDIMRHFTLF